MSFWSELKRRRVIKVGVAYALVGLGVGEGADIFLPQLGAPEWVVPVILAMLILGFPVIVLFAWSYEITPDGLRPTSHVEKTKSITAETGRKLNVVLLVLLAVAALVSIIEIYA